MSEDNFGAFAGPPGHRGVLLTSSDRRPKMPQCTGQLSPQNEPVQTWLVERCWPGMLCPRVSSLRPAYCALVPPGGLVRHCNSSRRNQDFRNDPSSIPVIIMPIVSSKRLPMAHGVPGQCKMFYPDEPKLHIHTNRQLERTHLKQLFPQTLRESVVSDFSLSVTPMSLSCSEPSMVPTSPSQRNPKSLNGPKGPCPSV